MKADRVTILRSCGQFFLTTTQLYYYYYMTILSLDVTQKWHQSVVFKFQYHIMPLN